MDWNSELKRTSFASGEKRICQMVVMRNGFLRQGLIDLINWLPYNNIKMVEVGSYAGESADLFAQSPKIQQLWCIDPWMPGYDSTDVASSSDFNEVEHAFDLIAQKHPNKIRKFKGVLKDFQSKFPNDVPDFIYIDANHTYDGCKSDIQTALLWKDVPIIGGHDYANWCPGVIQAVDEIFGKPTKTFADSSWVKSCG